MLRCPVERFLIKKKNCFSFFNFTMVIFFSSNFKCRNSKSKQHNKFSNGTAFPKNIGSKKLSREVLLVFADAF